MKRKLLTLLPFGLILFLIISVQAEASLSKPEVIINGELQQYEQSPIIKDDRILVPFRATFEELGIAVTWYPDSSIHALSDTVNLYLKVNSNKALLNGSNITLDVPPIIVNKRALVPLRFVAESLGANVSWNQKTNTVTITHQKKKTLEQLGCVSSNKSIDNTSLNIADFCGEYTFDEVAYMHKYSAISEEQYQNDLKAVTEIFTDVEFTIGESYFYETSGKFGENPSEGFEFITLQDYDDLVGENFDDFESLSSLFDYDGIKKELDVNEIKHYIMYVEGGILSNPAFYITKDNIFVANESITDGETDDTLNGYTHYLLKLKEQP